MLFALDGALLGATHVLSGPDHLVGVAPLAASDRRRIHPALVGASWGLGHGLGVALIGLLGQTILTLAQVEVASGWAERLVGLVLIGLGAHAFWRAGAITIHEHTHDHGEGVHTHLHVHDAGHSHAPTHARGSAHRHTHAAAVGIGTVHGLAGAGHLFAFTLPSLALGTADALLYLGGFLAASVVVMSLFGGCIGTLASLGGVRWLPTFSRLVALVTVGIGIWWTLETWGLLAGAEAAVGDSPGH